MFKGQSIVRHYTGIERLTEDAETKQLRRALNIY